jgi:hypothetical protein
MDGSFTEIEDEMEEFGVFVSDERALGEVEDMKWNVVGEGTDGEGEDDSHMIRCPGINDNSTA